MTAPECRRWLSAWAAQWLEKTYPVDPAADVQAYLSAVGAHPLDEAITTLGEVYLETGPEARPAIRDYFDDKRDFRQTLLAYIFRMASRLRRDAARRWVRSAIAAAAIEDGRLDYRDLIVALVILRWAAEHVGLEVRAEFEALADLASERTGQVIRGLLSRTPAEVTYTVRQMTAETWQRAFAGDQHPPPQRGA